MNNDEFSVGDLVRWTWQGNYCLLNRCDWDGTAEGGSVAGRAHHGDVATILKIGTSDPPVAWNWDDDEEDGTVLVYTLLTTTGVKGWITSMVGWERVVYTGD